MSLNCPAAHKYMFEVENLIYISYNIKKKNIKFRISVNPCFDKISRIIYNVSNLLVFSASRSRNVLRFT